MKKKVLAAPTLSLSLGDSFIMFLLLYLCLSVSVCCLMFLNNDISPPGGSGSITSDDLQSTFLSPSPDDAEDTALDFDLDALETPSDSESLHFPLNDLDLEGNHREQIVNFT